MTARFKPQSLPIPLAAIAVLLFSAAPLQAAEPGSPAAAVNVFIGTGGDGHTFPGASRPFGMVQLSPDTQHRHFRQSYPWAAGYNHGDGSILGFSHTHFSGSGHSDLGDVLLMPTAARPNWSRATPSGHSRATARASRTTRNRPNPATTRCA